MDWYLWNLSNKIKPEIGYRESLYDRLRDRLWLTLGHILKTVVKLFMLLFLTFPAFGEELDGKHVAISAIISSAIYVGCRKGLGIEDRLGCLGLSAVITFMGTAYFECLQGSDFSRDMKSNVVGILFTIPLYSFW